MTFPLLFGLLYLGTFIIFLLAIYMLVTENLHLQPTFTGLSVHFLAWPSVVYLHSIIKLAFRELHFSPGMVCHAFKPSTLEVGAGL